MDFNVTSHNVWYDTISSNIDLKGPGLWVKVTVGKQKQNKKQKNIVIALAPTFIDGF